MVNFTRFILTKIKNINMSEINISCCFPDGCYREMLQNIGLRY